MFMHTVSVVNFSLEEHFHANALHGLLSLQVNSQHILPSLTFENIRFEGPFPVG